MNTLKVIFDFLLSVTRLIFRGKGRHQCNKPESDSGNHTGTLSPQHGSGPGSHRNDTIALPENSPTPENLMGWMLIVCATGGYLAKLLG